MATPVCGGWIGHRCESETGDNGCTCKKKGKKRKRRDKKGEKGEKRKEKQEEGEKGERGKKVRGCGPPPVRKSTLPWRIALWGIREKNERQEPARRHVHTHVHTRTHAVEGQYTGLERSRVVKHATCQQSAGEYTRISYLPWETKGVDFFLP